MSVKDNKALVAQLKKLLADRGYEVKVSHLYEVLSKLSGYESWNVASAQNVELRSAFKQKDEEHLVFDSSQIPAFDFGRYVALVESGVWKNKVVLGISSKDKSFATADPYSQPGQVFVGGMGSGKSLAARFTLATHLACNSENTFYFLVDLFKGMFDYQDLFTFKSNVAPIIDSYEKLSSLLKMLSEEIEERKIEFDRVGAVGIDEYDEITLAQNKNSQRLTRIMVCIEEFHSIIGRLAQERNNPGTAGFHLRMIMRVGRSYGINVLVSTQRATANEFQSWLGAGLSFFMAFRLNNPGDAEAAGLPPADIRANQRGLCVFKDGFMQFPYLTGKDLLKVLRKSVKPNNSRFLTSNFQNMKPDRKK